MNIVLLFVLLLLPRVSAGEYKIDQDIVFGYKDGMALVMDIFTPNKESNGAGILVVMAGGMYSSPNWSHNATEDENIKILLDAGYKIFAVAHSSKPRYFVDEIKHDLPRAIRFVRYNATRFNIQPEHIGIMGYSSGGHMALLAATDPPEKDTKAKDPIDRQSSRVQAVVAFYPSTDNLNFGQENVTILEHFKSHKYKGVNAAFDFHQWDSNEERFERITDPDTIRNYLRLSSPITHVSKDDPPILLFHGDKDKLVPIQQSQTLSKRLGEVGVPHKLVVAKGESHGWDYPIEGQATEILNWFGQYLFGS